MSAERFTAKSEQQLADSLTKFLYGRDYLFATQATSSSTQSVKREFQTPTDDEDIYLPTEFEKISVTGERNTVVRGSKSGQPSDFTVIHKHVAVVDQIPPQIRHLLPQEVLDQYDNTDPGDLSEAHRVEYAIVVDPDSQVFINRDIAYKLRDRKHVIYKARESRVPQKALAYHPEFIQDGDLQAKINADFDAYVNEELGEMEQFWLDNELGIQITCINAIMNSLVTGRPVKKTD